MNVISFASRKGGSGKSTLAAHLAAYAAKPARQTLIIDCDPQGSLTLWHGLRGSDRPRLKSVTSGLKDAVEVARRNGYHWVFVDTPPNASNIVLKAIRHSTLVVIPARPSVFDV